MKCQRRLFLIILCAMAFFCAYAQKEDCRLRISLLNCAVGREVYATFGHSALRVTDTIHNTDLVYSFGTFHFDDPDFLEKFVAGRTDYFLSANDFASFTEEYQKYGRSVSEQVLRLDCQEKRAIQLVLESRLQDSAHAYPYDFVYDNCTTRLRDLIFQTVKDSLSIASFSSSQTTMRSLIHHVLDENGEPWYKLGFDIVFGSPPDDSIATKTALFLPETLTGAIATAQVKNRPLVEENQKVISRPSPIDYTPASEPLLTIFWICVLWFGLYHLPIHNRWKLGRLADSLLLYLTGLLGFFLLFLWWGTGYELAKNNYNLLWALPTNFIAFFFVWSQPAWLKTYFYAAFSITLILLAGWFWWPQKLNVSLMPFVVLLLYRYASLAMKNKTI